MTELQGRMQRVADLGPATRSDMFALYEQYYGGTNEQLFLDDLSDKQYAVILRDDDGTLQGFSSLKVWEEIFVGQAIRVMFSGDTIVHKDHWGQQALAFTWIHFSGALKSDAPDVPLYWFLLVKGHRTYRYLKTFYRVFYPAHTRSTPPDAKALMDHLAGEKFGTFYKPETGIVHFPQSRGHLKADWAEIPEKDRRRPDVSFFLERNPGYTVGDELVCLTELSQGNQNPLAARLFVAGFDGGLAAALYKDED
jgi:hypothetical protein